MYDFSNELSALGNDVVVYNCLDTSFFKAKPLTRILKKLYFSIFKHPSWYKFNDKVESKIISVLDNQTIRDADVIFFTGWSLAYDLQILSPYKGKKYNLIQDLEFWTGNKDTIIKSYLFDNITKLTYSNHILDYISNLNEKIFKVSISVDRNFFSIATPIVQREPESVCMMYSLEERKGSKYGIEALIKIKSLFPGLKVNLFGVPDAPLNLPNGFNYHQTPKNLSEIMNASAIFLTPSLWEGYGIPGIEAMHCGCAVVCSDAEGHLMYAKHNETALVFRAGEVNEIVNALTHLLENDEERIRIAINGNKFILGQKSWSECTEELVSFFLNQK